MKKLILAIALLFSLNSFAQQFNGVDISGDLTTFTRKIKEKGYTFVKTFENGAKFSGTISMQSVDIYVFTTPISKQIFKLVVYFPEKTTWTSIKDNYENLLEALTDKYGKPTKTYSFFSNPYYEGDGYEMTAVEIEKCFYLGIWEAIGGNLDLTVEITKYKQVEISYENKKNMAIKEREIKNIQNKVL